MLVAGIETSGTTGSVCAWVPEGPRHEEVFSEGLTHGRELARALERALESVNRRIGQVDLFGVSVGPGSYTGIRIGVVFARVLAGILDAGTVGISSLAAMAASVGPGPDVLVPVRDARWGRIYAAVFRRGRELRRVEEDALLEPEALCGKAPEGAFVFGDGVEKHRALYEDRFVLPAPGAAPRIRAQDVAALAWERWSRGVRTEALVPAYLKPWGPPKTASP
jgi:tRNA threonylcarbamoyladenosine biosynthesis protein TsaB